jgi:hypothetical protein
MKFFCRTQPAEKPAHDGTVGFLADLALVALPWGHQTYRFAAADGMCRGFVQFCPCPVGMVMIHRLWTPGPGHGNGSIMMMRLCELADRHGVQMLLKALPFGKKPYPLAREQLADWYRRHGFVGTHRRMSRPPALPSAAAAL